MDPAAGDAPIVNEAQLRSRRIQEALSKRSKHAKHAKHAAPASESSAVQACVSGAAAAATAEGYARPELLVKRMEAMLADERFADVARVALRALFDALPLDEQPSYVVHARCGDGRLLRALYEHVRDHTARGKALVHHPLTMVAVGARGGCGASWIGGGAGTSGFGFWIQLASATTDAAPMPPPRPYLVSYSALVAQPD